MYYVVVVDYESNVLFWVDAKLHHIACSDLLGNNQRIIMTSYQHLRHPFAITVFEVVTSYFLYHSVVRDFVTLQAPLSFSVHLELSRNALVATIFISYVTKTLLACSSMAHKAKLA